MMRAEFDIQRQMSNNRNYMKLMVLKFVKICSRESGDMQEKSNYLVV